MVKSVKFWIFVVVIAFGVSQCASKRSAENRLLRASPIVVAPQQGCEWRSKREPLGGAVGSQS